MGQIEKILCAKMVRLIAVVGEFPTFRLVFFAFLLLVDLAPNVGF